MTIPLNITPQSAVCYCWDFASVLFVSRYRLPRLGLNIVCHKVTNLLEKLWGMDIKLELQKALVFWIKVPQKLGVISESKRFDLYQII